jgi:hypothetical protein
MSSTARAFVILVSAAVSLGFASAFLAADPPTRMGTVDRISKTDSATTLYVSIQGELDQPADPKLATGTADPSQIMTPGGTTPSDKLAVGMPVKLVIVRQGAVFRYTIGTVDAVTDSLHCKVKVDRASLDRTFQDPTDDNKLHKIGEFLVEGASVAVWGISGD